MSDIRIFSSALRSLLAREAQRRRFMNSATTEEVRRELNISEAMAVELKNIVMAIPALTTPRPDDALDDGASANDASGMRTKALHSFDQTQAFLDSSFRQLRTAYRVSIAMSSTLFCVGMSFLVIAGIRSFTDPDGITGTAVVAGIGIVQIVALFYRNPLRDIAVAVASAQQSRISIMSYMLGVSLVGEGVYHGKHTEDALRHLAELTHSAVQHVGQWPTKEDRSVATAAN